MMEAEEVGAFWQIHDDRIIAALGGVVVMELLTQASHLYAHGGIQL